MQVSHIVELPKEYYKYLNQNMKIVSIMIKILKKILLVLRVEILEYPILKEYEGNLGYVFFVVRRYNININKMEMYKLPIGIVKKKKVSKKEKAYGLY